MSTYRAFEATGVHHLQLVERELAEPAPGMVRLHVEACGVCHTDVLALEGLRADPSQPIVPGHEIVGVIDAVGTGVTAWQAGDRVGVGFLNGHCWECEPCRRGDFVNCQNQEQTGTTTDGGYAEVAYARASGLVRIPEGLSARDAAPLLCAGLTTFNALQLNSARAGALVAVQGIGGLGHLALQYAHSLGYRVAAIARGTEKESLARQLGADEYIDSSVVDPGAALASLGGASVIVATASSGASMNSLVTGLAPHGKLVVVGAAPDPLSVSTPDLIFGTRAITGSLTGSAIENEDNLAFSLAHDIRPSVEIMPFDRALDAYERMLSGNARFRVVLDMTA
ncbi:alcohol dehydrogenase [Streptomyces sp. NBC_00687]|uniref:alcohol dehydrogenase n=1 Tax=Streptomyces sp. NBC_00687 TaxID=2975807 RepID=UPI0022544AC7|nr:alcohol dehydrogenase [Streptomyces sp. NBC_00687]MCX4919090.1 alcohol dehydrogenase [Streptomyces sp. NBC_00687]